MTDLDYVIGALRRTLKECGPAASAYELFTCFLKNIALLKADNAPRSVGS